MFALHHGSSARNACFLATSYLYLLPLYLLDDVIGCRNSFTYKKTAPISFREWITVREPQVLLLKHPFGTYGISRIAEGTHEYNMSRGVHGVNVSREFIYNLCAQHFYRVIHTDNSVELPP